MNINDLVIRLFFLNFIYMIYGAAPDIKVTKFYSVYLFLKAMLF